MNICSLSYRLLGTILKVEKKFYQIIETSSYNLNKVKFIVDLK